MDNNTVVEYLIEIKESIAELKIQNAELKDDMTQHRQEAFETKKAVDGNSKSINTAKGIAIGLGLLSTLLSVASAAKAFLP